MLVQRKQTYFLWTVALTLVVSHLVALRTATPHFVVFNLVLFFYLARISRNRGGLVAVGSVAVGNIVYLGAVLDLGSGQKHA